MGDWNAGSLRASVRIYNDHLRAIHPEFRHWKRKLSATYTIPILLLLVSVPVEAWLYPTSSFNFYVVLPFWFAALFIGLVIISVRDRGARRYRGQWLKEHGQPLP